jgi:hypothetical protein
MSNKSDKSSYLGIGKNLDAQGKSMPPNEISSRFSHAFGR